MSKLSPRMLPISTGCDAGMEVFSGWSYPGANRYQSCVGTGEDGVRCHKALWREEVLQEVGRQWGARRTLMLDVECVHEWWEMGQSSLRKAAKGKGVSLWKVMFCLAGDTFDLQFLESIRFYRSVSHILTSQHHLWQRERPMLQPSNKAFWLLCF